jgi:sulfonate transport system substrate-binding protein
MGMARAGASRGVAGTLLGLAISLGSLASPAAADGPLTIRFGVSSAGVGNPPRVSTGWTSVAQLRGYLEREFAKDGIPVRWVFFKGQGPAVNEALANDQLDFTTLGDLPALIGRSAGLDTRILLVNNARLDVYVAVPPQSPAARIEDLRGKRIAFHKGTSTQLAVDRILEFHGLGEKDVRVVSMEPAVAQAALLAGQVDAIFGSLDLAGLQERKLAKVIYDTRNLPAATSLGYILGRRRFIQDHPDLTRRAVKALVEAAHWASQEEHRDSIFALWAAAGKVPEHVHRQRFEGVPLAFKLTPLLDGFIVAHIGRGVRDALKYRLIRKPVDAASWIDTTYLDAALRELKLEGFWPRFDGEGRPSPLR